jgi:sulfotransferase family protein
MSFAENYSFIDRTLHHLAFSVPGTQKLVADLESDFYRKKLSTVNSCNEIFVTGLPRSGTTLLLDFLYQTDEFCTYSYRHMPFILAPLLWKKMSNPFSKKAESVERAHGDGMEVSFDSPEAFEEVIWLSYLKNKYVMPDRLTPLTLKNTSKLFASKLSITINKLILEARVDGQPADKRYISKNNANCSRIPVIKRLFPQATILIPFREPLAHIGSLMKQHQLFSEMHKDDKFARHYMKWLGHYDFGDNFKPIDFDNWLDNLKERPDYSSENFWLQYWIAGYKNLAEQKSDNTHLIDYNKLLSQPKESLSSIAKVSKLKQPQDFVLNASKLRAPTSAAKTADTLSSDLLDEANQLYAKLVQLAL